MSAATGAAADAHPGPVLHPGAGCGPHITAALSASPKGSLSSSEAGAPAQSAILAKAAERHVTWLPTLRCLPIGSRHAKLGAPSAAVYSLNWSGYVAPVTSPNYAQAEWTVPAVTSNGSEPAYSSIWPGIGGSGGTSGTLIQAGTEQDATASGQSNFFWVEAVPEDPYELRISNLVPHVGDDVATAVSWSNRTAFFTLCDYTQQTCVNVQQSGVAAPGGSAEWVVERPTLGSGVVADLAAFATVDVGNAYYGTGGGMYSQASAGGQATIMLNSAGSALAVPGGLASDGASFADYWLAYH